MTQNSQHRVAPDAIFGVHNDTGAVYTVSGNKSRDFAAGVFIIRGCGCTFEIVVELRRSNGEFEAKLKGVDYEWLTKVIAFAERGGAEQQLQTLFGDTPCASL